MSPRTKEQLATIREEKSHQIKEAALTLFASKGYESTSISEIAREAGVSKGLIYNYFESKEEILTTLINGVFEQMWSRFGWIDKEEITKEDYIDFINQSIDIVLDDIDHFKLWFAVLTQPKVLALVLDDLWQKTAPMMKMMMDYYEKQGYENPEVQMRYNAAVMDGIQMHIMLDPENFPVEEVRRILIKQLTS